MRGQFHESYCHRFLASQENIVVRFLTDEGEARTEETKSIKLGERVLKKFDNVSELTVTDYGVPKSKNFAAVDYRMHWLAQIDGKHGQSKLSPGFVGVCRTKCYCRKIQKAEVLECC